MGDYFDLDWSQRFTVGGPRPVSAVSRIVIHTTENDATTKATDVAAWQISSQTGSYHAIADRRQVVRCNTRDWATWSSGNDQGNRQGMNLSFVARAAWSRQQWLAESDMLKRGARVAARWSHEMSVPVVKTDGTERGYCGHGDLRKFGGTTHTDPGPNFPWDAFLGMVRIEINNLKGINPVAPKPTGSSTNRLLDLTLDQLVGAPWADFPGWPQLGNRTIVDALAEIGKALEVKGFDPKKKG